MNKWHSMKPVALAVILTAQAGAGFAQQENDNSDLYSSVVNDPRGSIVNSEFLTKEQKTELLQTYDSANGKAVPACGTILCMSGTMQGGDGGSECRGPINKYFDIKKYRKDKFSPSRTAAARADYLEKCDAPDSKSDKARINAKYGTLYNSPF